MLKNSLIAAAFHDATVALLRLTRRYTITQQLGLCQIVGHHQNGIPHHQAQYSFLNHQGTEDAYPLVVRWQSRVCHEVGANGLSSTGQRRAIFASANYPLLARIAGPEVSFSVPWLSHVGWLKSAMSNALDKAAGIAMPEKIRHAAQAPKLFYHATWIRGVYGWRIALCRCTASGLRGGGG
jgi:hypothetical protein